MNNDWVYITPEEYAEAAEIGVSKRTLNARKKAGWERKRAITQTVKKGKSSRINKRKKPLQFTPERLALMEKYGITRKTAQRRYHKYNWDIEEIFVTAPQLNNVTSARKKGDLNGSEAKEVCEKASDFAAGESAFNMLPRMYL